MTTIIVKRQQNSIIQVECYGHSDYADEGEDIVCASISSITQTALLGLKVVANVEVESLRDDDIGYLKFKLSDNLGKVKRHECDMILDTMYAGLKDIESGFSKYVKVEDK